MGVGSLTCRTGLCSSRSKCGSLADIVAYLHCTWAAVDDSDRAGHEVVSDDSTPDTVAQLDLGFGFPELATANNNGTAVGLDCVAAFFWFVPLNKRAIAKSDRTTASYSSDLIARSPERAVDKPHSAAVSALDFDHGWVGSMERHEFTVGNQQAERGGFLYDDGGVTIIGAYAEEIAVAHSSAGPDEVVADRVPEAERVEDVLPVSAPESEGNAVGHLPSEQLGFCAPPGVEMDVFDSADVIDLVHIDAAPEGLAVNVADQVAFVSCGVDSIVRVQKFDGEDSRVFAAHGNCPRVGVWHVVDFLFRVIDDDAFEGAVVVERDEWGTVFVAGVFGYEKSGAIVRGFW